MSLEDAKKFILEATKNNKEVKNILANTNSKFESKEAKGEYIASKAKELGFNFSAKEFAQAFLESKKNLTEEQLSKIAGGSYFENSSDDVLSKAKDFWKSLW